MKPFIINHKQTLSEKLYRKKHGNRKDSVIFFLNIALRSVIKKNRRVWKYSKWKTSATDTSGNFLQDLDLPTFDLWHDIGIVLLKIHCHYFNNPVRLSPDTQLFSISLCLVMSGHCQYYLSFHPSGHKLHLFRCTFVDKWNVEPTYKRT